MNIGIQEMALNMKRDGAHVVVHSEVSAIHAWPVAALFLGETRDERLKGLNLMTDYISLVMGKESAIRPRKVEK